MTRTGVLQDWFGLPLFAARVLSVLVDGAEPIAPARLADLSGLTSIGSLRVAAVHLRQALDCEALDTTPTGYVLTDIGRAEVDAVINARPFPPEVMPTDAIVRLADAGLTSQAIADRLGLRLGSVRGKLGRSRRSVNLAPCRS